jgi:hypothetical protein
MKCKIKQCKLPGPRVRCGRCNQPVCQRHAHGFGSLLPLCQKCWVEPFTRAGAGMASATRGRARTFTDRKKEADRNACRGEQHGD